MLQFRIDVVGLDSEDKPTTQIKNGTTYYTVDSHKLFIYYNGEWYDQEQEFVPPEETSEDNSENVENNSKVLIEEPEIEKTEEPEIEKTEEPEIEKTEDENEVK